MSDKSIEQVMADWRERANALRLTGHAHDGRLIDQILDEVAEAVPDYLTWLTEAEAELYTGLKRPTLRTRFPSLEARGLAKWDPERRRRLYRRQGLEHRGNAEAAREAGRRAARKAS